MTAKSKSTAKPAGTMQRRPWGSERLRTAVSAKMPASGRSRFEFQDRRSTFLPQVWEQLPEPADFLAHLERKAGLPADFWHSDVRLWRYTVMKWAEPQ